MAVTSESAVHVNSPCHQTGWTYAGRRLELRQDELLIFMVFAAAMVLVCLLPPQSDTFFHLRAGQTIWQSRAPVTTDPFSYTFHGRAWLNHEWLSQLLFYGAFALGGPPLLTFVCGLSIIIAVLASWRLTRGAPEIRLVLLVSLLTLTAPQWAVRPQALSLALLTLAMWLVLREKIHWLPLLIAIWANAHGVVVFGVVIACVSAFEAMAWSRHLVRPAVLVAALSVAAPMLTPLGWRYWPRVFETVASARLLGLYEYRSAFADATSIPFWLMLGALVVVLLRRIGSISHWDRPDRLLVLTSCLLGGATILSIRNAAAFALLAVPAIARLLQAPTIRRPSPLGRSGYALVAVVALTAIGLVGYTWRDDGAGLGWRPFSPAALTAIRECPKPIYNEYGEGGTLMWFVPEQANFVDGRVEAYPLDFLLRVMNADRRGQYEDLFREYGIRCAVAATGSPIARALRADSAMTVRYADERWSIFESDRSGYR